MTSTIAKRKSPLSAQLRSFLFRLSVAQCHHRWLCHRQLLPSVFIRSVPFYNLCGAIKHISPIKFHSASVDLDFVVFVSLVFFALGLTWLWSFVRSLLLHFVIIHLSFFFHFLFSLTRTVCCRSSSHISLCSLCSLPLDVLIMRLVLSSKSFEERKRFHRRRMSWISFIRGKNLIANIYTWLRFSYWARIARRLRH